MKLEEIVLPIKVILNQRNGFSKTLEFQERPMPKILVPDEDGDGRYFEREFNIDYSNIMNIRSAAFTFSYKEV